MMSCCTSMSQCGTHSITPPVAALLGTLSLNLSSDLRFTDVPCGVPESSDSQSRAWSRSTTPFALP